MPKGFEKNVLKLEPKGFKIKRIKLKPMLGMYQKRSENWTWFQVDFHLESLGYH
jgi:hypothetical protein